MFFILSKVLDFLLSPLVWIVGLLLFALIAKNIRYKKRSFYFGFALLLFFSNPFIADRTFRAWEGEPVPMSSVGNYELGIVLTGVTMNMDDIPDRVFFSKGADRVLHAVQLYKGGKIKKILISGGSGSVLRKDIPESDKLRQVMLYSGVKDSDIIIENRSRNTRENALFSKQVIDSLGLKGGKLLITSAFHMRRSMGCFDKVEVGVEPFKVDFYHGSSGFRLDDLVPNEYSLYLWNVLIHEVTGNIVYRLLGYQ